MKTRCGIAIGVPRRATLSRIESRGFGRFLRELCCAGREQRCRGAEPHCKERNARAVCYDRAAPKTGRATRTMLPEPDDTLDTFGRLCPVPIIMTAKRIRTLAAGGVLAVLSDDRGIIEDMPLWCRASRNELLALDEIAPGEWRALVRKGTNAR